VFLSTEQKMLIIQSLREQIPALKALYLFGSYAEGVASGSSDIDIAYLSSESIPQTARWEISQALASQLSIDVDLIDLANTNTIFRYQIISKGERLYGDGYEVESFETLAYSFYLRFQEERQPIVDAIYEDKKVLHV